jgi:hypothetical protein
MGFLDNMMKRGGSSEEVEGYTPTGPGTDIATSGGRRRRKSLRRKGARKGVRKGTSKRSRKHYGGKSYQKHQQGGDTLEELVKKLKDGVELTTDEKTEYDRLTALQTSTEEEKGPSDAETSNVAELSDEEIITKYESDIERGDATTEAYHSKFTKSPETLVGGGSRRRKSRHNKKTHSKKTRGKKTSPWIKHVLQFAKDNKMKYFQALKDKRCRATYKSSK